MNESGKGSSGRMLEIEQLGELSKNAREIYNKFERILDTKSRFMDVVKVVENSQREECIRPSTYFTKGLRLKVSELLGLDLKDNPFNVEYYRALHTILDKDFGTDAFLRIKQPGTKFSAVVTLDVTQNTSKVEHKANVIVLFPEGSLDETNPEEKIKLNDLINKTAGEIVEQVETHKKKFFKMTS